MIRDDVLRLRLRAPRNRSTLSPPAPFYQLERIAPRLELLVTEMLAGTARAFDGAARALAGGARLAERLADLPKAAPPAQPSWTLRASVGDMLSREILVTNERRTRLIGVVTSTDWYSDKDTRGAEELVRFDPPLVSLAPGGMQPVQVQFQIPAELTVGATYRATFFVAGSADFRLPAELQISNRNRDRAITIRTHQKISQNES